MKSTIFRDITPCNPLKVNPRNISPPTSRSNNPFRLVSCSTCSALKMEAICSTEILGDFQQTTWHYIPEDRTLHNHCCENIKSCKIITSHEWQNMSDFVVPRSARQRACTKQNWRTVCYSSGCVCSAKWPIRKSAERTNRVHSLATTSLHFTSLGIPGRTYARGNVYGQTRR
jgi:hypothetical protein